jgi:hypothetical protein
MAWPRLDGMAELCRWQVWPYSIQRAGKTLMTSKISLSETSVIGESTGRYVMANMEMCGRVAKKKVRQTNFLLWAPRRLAPVAQNLSPNDGVTHATNGRISACRRNDIVCVSRRRSGRARFAGNRSRLSVSLVGRVITAPPVRHLVIRL